MSNYKRSVNKRKEYQNYRRRTIRAGYAPISFDDYMRTYS
jgi:hypothetical protein